MVFAASNNFTGSIPNVFPSNSSIELFHVDYNQLTGPLPSSLANAANLVDIDTTQNSLTGTIPSAIGSITSLQNFVVKMNNLSGKDRTFGAKLLQPVCLRRATSAYGALRGISQRQSWHGRARYEQRTVIFFRRYCACRVDVHTLLQMFPLQLGTPFANVPSCNALPLLPSLRHRASSLIGIDGFAVNL